MVNEKPPVRIQIEIEAETAEKAGARAYQAGIRSLPALMRMLIRAFADGNIRLQFSNTVSDAQLLELMENKLNDFLLRFRRDQEEVQDRLLDKTAPSF